MVADAGYRAVALSMRGYGLTDAPNDIDRYSVHHLVSDVVGVVNGLGETSAVVVGHDWGAPVAWFSACSDRHVPRRAALSVRTSPRWSAVFPTG